MGLLDWFRGRPSAGGDAPPITWHVSVQGKELVAEDNRGNQHRAPLSGAKSVRIVPLSSGNSHVVAHTRGWQVALARADGDVLVGSASADWRTARELAQRVCERTQLPLDELTEKLFSRVGQYSPPAKPS